MGFQIENGVMKKYTEEWGVTEVVIPDSMTSIGEGAFAWCSSLTTVTIPDSVTQIGSSAFSDTRWLNNYPNDLVIVGKGVLYKYKGKDTNVVIPDNVMSIGECAFQWCKSLTTVTIGDSVTSIGRYAFYDCSSLTTVTIGNSVTSIGDASFKDCTSLSYIKLSQNLSKLTKNMFDGSKFSAIYSCINGVTGVASSLKRKFYADHEDKHTSDLMSFLRDNIDSKTLKATAFNKLAAFVSDNIEDFSEEDVKELITLAEKKKAKAVIEIFKKMS